MRNSFLKAYFLLIFLTILLNASFASSETRLIAYPAPEGAAQNSDFSVSVRIPGQKWQELPEYLIKVDEVRGTNHAVENSSMSYFDFSGEVEVSVTYNKGDIQNRPNQATFVRDSTRNKREYPSHSGYTAAKPFSRSEWRYLSQSSPFR